MAKSKTQDPTHTTLDGEAELDKYVREHSDEEPEYLYRLYRDTNVRLLHGRMASGHLQGRLLKMLTQMEETNCDCGGNEIVGGAIPKEFIPCIDQGIQGAMLNGVLAGYSVVDVKCTVVDGSFHEVDSSEMAFKICGSMAFKEACQKADPVLLEPIMKVRVIVPEDYLGDVMGDLNGRRGQITNMETRNGTADINADVPLSEMFGYTTDLRSRTQGRGMFTMQFDHYEEVPKSVAEKIIGKRQE